MNRLLGPRWVFPVYWFVFLAMVLVIHPSSTLDADAALIIGLFSAVFLLGAVAATFKTSNVATVQVDTDQPRDGILNEKRTRWVIIIGSTSNLIAAVLAIRDGGFRLSDIDSMSQLATTTNSLSVDRYAGVGSSPVVFFLLGVGYVAALIAPFISLTTIKHKLAWIALPALTALAYSTVTSARLGFLVAGMLTLGGVIGCSIIRNGVAPKLKPRIVLAVLLIGIIVGAAFTALGVLRTGRLDGAAWQATIEKQASYTVGTVGAFSSWYDTYWQTPPPELGWGTASMAGMEFITGQDREATRAYGEFVYVDTDGRKSNVYTAFRGLILDFGIPGTVVLLGIVGFIFGRLYLHARSNSLTAAVVLSFGYASIFFSGWMATTTFTNIAAVVVVAPLIVLFLKQDTSLNSGATRKEHRMGAFNGLNRYK